MKAYLLRVLSYDPPSLEEIPYGCWAELKPGEKHWKIYTTKEPRPIPPFARENPQGVSL